MAMGQDSAGSLRRGRNATREAAARAAAAAADRAAASGSGRGGAAASATAGSAAGSGRGGNAAVSGSGRGPADSGFGRGGKGGRRHEEKGGYGGKRVTLTFGFVLPARSVCPFGLWPAGPIVQGLRVRDVWSVALRLRLCPAQVAGLRP